MSNRKRARLRVYREHNGIYEHMVAAPNQKEAARLLNTTVYSLRNWGQVVENEEDVALAVSEPGTIWSRPMDQHRSPWERKTPAPETTPPG